MRLPSPALQGTDATQVRSHFRQRLALAALVFLLPWTTSALDRARFTATPEPGRAEAFAVRLDDDMLMSGRLGDLARIQSLRDSLAGDFLWMRHEGLEYVLQDPGLLERIDELWSKGDEALLREEKELAEGRGALLKERKENLEERREEIRREQSRVAAEKSRLSDEHSALFWRKFDLDMQLLRIEDEDARSMILTEIYEIQRVLDWDLSARQDRNEREADELERQMEALDPEEDEIEREEDAIWKVKRQVDARRDELFRTLDETLLRLLEQGIAEGTVQPHNQIPEHPVQIEKRGELQ